MRSIAVAMLSCALAGSVAASPAVQPAPHTAHEGRYGGAFTTAANDSLHVEAVWSEQRRLRLFVTDASGDPLTMETLRNMTAVAIAGGAESPAQLIEIDGHFEARIPTLQLPAAISVRFTSSPQAAAEILRFRFDAYTRQIDDIARPSPAETPDTLAGILRVLEEDRRALQTIDAEQVDAGRMLPIEDRIRERVLAIEQHLDPLPADQRRHVQSAITDVVRSCWQLHVVMDHGNGEQLTAAVAQLTDALTRIRAATAGLAR